MFLNSLIRAQSHQLDQNFRRSGEGRALAGAPGLGATPQVDSQNQVLLDMVVGAESPWPGTRVVEAAGNIAAVRADLGDKFPAALPNRQALEISRECELCPKALASGRPTKPGPIIRLAVVVLLAANLVAGYFVMRPIGGSPEELRKQAGGYARSAAPAAEQLGRTGCCHEDRSGRGRKATSSWTIISCRAGRAYSTVLAELNQAANESHIQAQGRRLRDRADRGQRYAQMMQISANYEGSYADLIHFINLIDKSDSLLIIEGLGATPQQGAGLLNITLEARHFCPRGRSSAGSHYEPKFSGLGAEPKKASRAGRARVLWPSARILYNRDARRIERNLRRQRDRASIAPQPAATAGDNQAGPRSRRAAAGRADLQEFRPSLKPKKGEEINRADIDPTLRLDLLEKVQKVGMEGGNAVAVRVLVCARRSRQDW